METKDVQLQGKAQLILIFFVAPSVAQDQRSYSVCVLSHEQSSTADLSSDVQSCQVYFFNNGQIFSKKSQN